MKAVLTNFGTRGEVYPMLALAQELEKEGHRAILALSPEYRNWANKLGLDFVPLGPSCQPVFDNLTLAAQASPGFFNSSESMVELLRPIKDSLPEVYHRLRETADGADVLIGGHLQPVAKMLHEITGMPFVSLFATNIVCGATSDAYKQATQWLVNPCREELRLAPLRDPLAGDSHSNQLAIYALSPSVIPRHPNWPAYFHMVGYFQLQEDYWTPSNGLCDFLLSGPPPVVVSFGSVVHSDSGQVLDLLARTAQLAKCRMIVQRENNRLDCGTVSDDIYLIDYAPHTWLFSRASCVVHHGGSGTSAAVFRAGIPSIFVPHILDQALWAHCARRLGIAGTPIPFSQLTAQNLAQLIVETLANSNFQYSATRLAARIRSEKGIQVARLLIEKIAGRERRRRNQAQCRKFSVSLLAKRQKTGL